MKIRASSAARQDLHEIFDFIARENPSAAKRVRDAIRRRIATLSRQPERGMIVERDGEVPLRRLIEGPFLIFYLVQADTVLVTRIMRGRRDIGAELTRESGLDAGDP